ncbi:MAG: cysteine hydrolase [Chloroflexi bacterium]|nr:cysteine hydrolase [Chloroflexota bacterium]
MADFVVVPNRTALINVDLQNCFVKSAPDGLTVLARINGTDLELILRSRGIDTVIISGISTPVCCDTTAREANARDFRVLFLSNATASGGSDAAEAARFHNATLENLDGLFAQVLSTDELLTKIDQAGPLVAS